MGYMTNFELTLNILLLSITGLFLFTTYKGLVNEWVIYEDRKDFLRTLMMAIGLVFSIFLFNLEEIPDLSSDFFVNWIVAPMAYLATTVLIFDCFYLCITNNHNAYITGSLIALFRLLYIFLAFFLIFKIFDNALKAHTYRTSLINIALAGSVGYGLCLLINGEAVKKKRQARGNLSQILE